MEIRGNMAAVRALLVAAFLGLACCIFAYVSLDRAHRNQQRELEAARRQLIGLQTALATSRTVLEKQGGILTSQQNDVDALRKEVAGLKSELAESVKQNQELTNALARSRPTMNPGFPAMDILQKLRDVQNAAPEVAAADSVEGKLASQGKTWKQVNGPIATGGYVEDILAGRLDQPRGRGRVGKVVFSGAVTGGPNVSTVDFGRGYVVGIDNTELCLVIIVGKGGLEPPAGAQPAPDQQLR